MAASGLPAPASATESPGVGSLPEQAPASATETHTVVAGESLWRIAEAENPEAHNAQIAERVAELIAANPEVHANPDLIFPGQILNIPGATS